MTRCVIVSRVAAVLTAAVLAGAFARAQGPGHVPLTDRRIRLEAGPSMALHVPVSLPYAGPHPGLVEVEELATGKTFPATIRDGVFTFVPEGGMPHTTHLYAVRPELDERPVRVRIESGQAPDTLRVVVNDAPLAAFHGGGNGLPRLEPLIPGGASGDRPAASSRAGLNSVNGVDFWREGDGAGRQRVKALAHDDGDAYGWIRAEIAWEGPRGEPVLDEVREYRFYATPVSSRLIDVTCTLTAAHGDVVFGGTADTGFFVMDADPGATIEKSGDGDWCQLSTDEGGRLAIAVFDHPDNLNHPPAWVTTKEGRLAANPFSARAGENATGHRLPAGETLTLRYRVLLHPGGADTAGRYADFAEPPRLQWVAP